MDRVVIAQDDELYLSFPDVALASDGRLVVIYREADAHVATRSRLVVKDSRDGGRTWSAPRYLDSPMSLAQDGAVWNCPRLVRQSDGGLTALCDLSVCPPGAGPVPEEQRRFRTFLWRSFDNGLTWSMRRPTRIQGLVPDRLLELSEDTWLVGSHYHSLRHFRTMTQIVTFTHDAGENWNSTSIVAEVPGMQFCEGSVIKHPDGYLVCFLRENSMRSLPTHQCFSHDGGLHWSQPEPCAFIGHRPVAGVLRSGKVLVTYRDVRLVNPDEPKRRGANTATMAWLGDPRDGGGGKVLTLEHDSSGVFGDYGYSGWVQLPDGRVFCAYHTRGEAPKSYLAGVWFREADFTEPAPALGKRT